ncbi:MAG: O-antigen ligase family protein [Pseudonocardia sp.]
MLLSRYPHPAELPPRAIPVARAAGIGPTLDATAAVALGTALAYGVLAQGGFNAGQLVDLALLVVVAAGARMLVGRRPPAAHVRVCAGAWTAFAAWALLLGYARGDADAAVPAAAVATCLAVAVLTAHALTDTSRAFLRATVIGTGVFVAVSGWVGVALHVEPLALPSSGMWRAASTLTYANAQAAFLVAALFVALHAVPRDRRLLGLTVTSVLLLGLASTMSRAGLLALGAGCAAHLLLGSRADRDRLRAVWPAAPAALVAFTGLLPSLPENAAAQPLLALSGLAGGLAVLLASGRAGPRRAGAAIVAAAMVALPFSPVLSPAVDGIGATRLTATSLERDDLTRVTLEQFATAPVVGVGPGRLDLSYVDHRGVAVQAQYTHDEYLQIAAETGLVGAGLAVAGLVALAFGALRRDGPLPRGPPVAAALVTAFAVHSAFDFLWHIPVLPLVLVLSVAAATPAPRPKEPS